AGGGGAGGGGGRGCRRRERGGRRTGAEDGIDEGPPRRRARVLGGGAVNDADGILDPRPPRPTVVHYDALDRLVAVVVVPRLEERSGPVVPVAEQAVRPADGVRMLQALEKGRP